jgi:hypothetical protein
MEFAMIWAKDRKFEMIARKLVAILAFFSSVVYAELPVFSQEDPAGASSVNAEQQRENDQFFEARIRPILVETCLPCHNEIKSSGSLQLSSRELLMQGGDSGMVLREGHAAESLLIQAIRRDEGVSPMPPEKSKSLRPDQIADFTTWVEQGAHWPTSTPKFVTKSHWSFQSLTDPSIPPAKDPTWIRNAIDAFILARQEAVGAVPAKQADKRTLIRRATYDLTGLPPTVEEIDAFLADESPTAWEKVIQRLLESKAYGEKWGRHWLDVVRYADTAGETADYPVPTAWKYRNYVIKSFNDDKPYNDFVREQIAGDIIGQNLSPHEYGQCVAATGYVAVSRRFGFDSENYHHLTIQDTLDTMGQSILGLSLGCARCHDHKFDPVTMRDYYALYGIFSSSRYAFPGSEQKPRVRSLMPMMPPTEANRRWRQHRSRIAELVSKLQARSVAVPNAVLGSISDIDGDFELQAPAAGGSKGVLVPPWNYDGNIEVSTSAQSPFRNLFPKGNVGALVPSQAVQYRIDQALYPIRDSATTEKLYVNVDFRVLPGDDQQRSSHRIILGSHRGDPCITVDINRHRLAFLHAEAEVFSQPIEADRWYNLTIAIDLKAKTIQPTLATDTSVTSLASLATNPTWDEKIGWVTFTAKLTDSTAYPAIAYDQFAIDEDPILPPQAAGQMSESSTENLVALQSKLASLVGIEGHFDFQKAGTGPATPWNSGPNSVVQISTEAQSPFENHYERGGLGIFMPNRGDYDGFGCTFPDFVPGSNGTLHVSFDFNSSDVTQGGDGSWRYYLGHGPGVSAAVELFFNGHHFYHRSGDNRDPVTEIAPGTWYQVQLKLDLSQRTYSGELNSADRKVPFSGQFASNWDGAIDYTFIDSYGHIGGVRPALKADNFVITPASIATFETKRTEEEWIAFRQSLSTASALRERIAKLQNESTRLSEELNRLLIEGPFPMAYAITEGTPLDSKIQKRGEPEQLGDEVPRGFIAVLAGEVDLAQQPGSGRLPLANWLVDQNNPLTARVMVNRIWQYHFGQGLVRTPNDFGVRGELPSHPELLDFLASRFIEQGWSIKAMHRLIMQSSTYQQSSTMSPAMQELATQQDLTKLYVHYQRRRLSAEEIRDSMLAISGRLDRTMGEGHPFPSPISWGYSQHGPYNAVYDHEIRSVYLMVQRIKRHPFLALFDGADPNTSTAVRLGTTVPTQSLYFLNDPFVHQQADAWRDRLLGERGDFQQGVRLAHLEATGLPADDKLILLAQRFQNRYQQELSGTSEAEANKLILAAYLRTLYSSNAFLYVD